MTPLSGPISLTDIRNELGLTGPITLNDPNVRRLLGNPGGSGATLGTGAISLTDAYACGWISKNNYPNPNVYSTPAGVTARLVLAPGLTVYGNSYGVYALAILPGTNGTCNFDNYGTVVGIGGAPGAGNSGAGQAGGNALYGYANGGGSATLNVRNFGTIYGGGGGGGGGGVGGQGGYGYYVATGTSGAVYSVPNYWAAWDWESGSIRETRMKYAGTTIYDAWWTQGNGIGYGGFTYYFGSYQYSTPFFVDNGYGGGNPTAPPPGPGGTTSCFPAGSLVMMGDRSQRPIETLHAGDIVMTVDGPAPLDFMGTPILGDRKMLYVGSHFWSEEHSHWSRDSKGDQWLWTANKPLWTSEVEQGVLGGLTDNSTIRTGEGYELATLKGWEHVTPKVGIGWGYNTQLYFPNCRGSFMIVDGYVVSAGFDQSRFDPNSLNWDEARLRILGEDS